MRRGVVALLLVLLPRADSAALLRRRPRPLAAPALLLRLRGGQEPAPASQKPPGSPPTTTADVHVSADTPPSPSPGLLARLLNSAPVAHFRSAPPITRSWVTVSVLLTVLASQRLVDLRSIAFAEREVVRRGEWWRTLLNFFYMGEQPLSVFYWLQIYHLWECMRILELVKYAWEPGQFVRMIVSNIASLLLLKQLSPSLMFLGTPLVMVFMYVYAREYESSITNFLGFFQIRTGWLPFAQMVQDGVQTGDMMPNLLGLLAGHFYFYTNEVAPRMLLPSRPPTLAQFVAAMDKAAPPGSTPSEGEEELEAAAEGGEEEGEGGEEEVEAAAEGGETDADDGDDDEVEED